MCTDHKHKEAEVYPCPTCGKYASGNGPDVGKAIQELDRLAEGSQALKISLILAKQNRMTREQTLVFCLLEQMKIDNNLQTTLEKWYEDARGWTPQK